MQPVTIQEANCIKVKYELMLNSCTFDNINFNVLRLETNFENKTAIVKAVYTKKEKKERGLANELLIDEFFKEFKPKGDDGEEIILDFSDCL